MMARVQYLFYILIFVSNLSFIFLSILNAYKLQDSNEASQLMGETTHYSYVLSVPLLLGFEQPGSKKKSTLILILMKPVS